MCCEANIAIRCGKSFDKNMIFLINTNQFINIKPPERVYFFCIMFKPSSADVDPIKLC